MTTSKYLSGALRLKPSSSTPILKVLKGMVRGGGMVSLSIWDDHSMCSLFTADSDILVKMTASKLTIAIENTPPVNVLKSGSYRYRISSVVEKKSAWFISVLRTFKNFICFQINLYSI